MEYSISITENIDSIDVLATPEDNTANVYINGNNSIPIGTSNIIITVIAQNGEQREYKIVVNKSDEAKKNNSFLENLSIENAVLVPEFKANITNYLAEVESSVENLNVLAIPQVEGARAEIQGEKNLKFGENEVKIIVTSQNETNTTVYTIKVSRKTENETVIEDEKQNLLYQEEIAKEESIEEKSNEINWFLIFPIFILIAVRCRNLNRLFKK